MVVEGLWPEIDAGRFPVKRVVSEDVWVEADVFADGHDLVAAVLRHRSSVETNWREVRMQDIGNDRFRGCFTVEELGEFLYTVVGWIDLFASWRRDLRKKVDAGRDVAV
ncbi:MAG: maltotransferase domain-containing protein, partial [Actinomycetota bacterium]